MALRDLILKGEQGTQTREEGKARLLDLLTGTAIIDELRRMRAGHAVGQNDFVEHSLTHAEFHAAVTDAAVRKRLTELAAEGISAQIFDGEETRTGIRGKSLKVALMPFPTAPHERRYADLKHG